MTRQRADPRSLVHTPAEVSSEVVEWATDIKKNPGIQFGIDAIDKVVIPMRPGNLISIIGRPGHAKSSLLVYLARLHAKRILERGKDEEEAVVYVTWEQSSEELGAMLMASPDVSYTDIAWGRADIDKITSTSIKSHMPVWIIGHGITRPGLSVPRMTPDLVLAAVESIQKDFGRKPVLMLFDYLQLIPTRQAKERIQQVTEMPILLKELALRLKAPAVAAVQAARTVDQREIQIPEMNEAQWASSIEQTCDKCFGIWRPVKTMDDGDEVEVGGKVYTVNENLLILRLLKQRGDVGRHTWGMYFDPALMRLAELETRQSNNGQGREYPVNF